MGTTVAASASAATGDGTTEITVDYEPETVNEGIVVATLADNAVVSDGTALDSTYDLVAIERSYPAGYTAQPTLLGVERSVVEELGSPVGYELTFAFDADIDQQGPPAHVYAADGTRTEIPFGLCADGTDGTEAANLHVCTVAPADVEHDAVAEAVQAGITTDMVSTEPAPQVHNLPAAMVVADS